MISLTFNKEKAFGLIELLIVVAIIGLLYYFKPQLFNPSKNNNGYIEQRLAMKKQAENQVKDIQNTLKKRYQTVQ